jgi:hypothetical protein
MGPASTGLLGAAAPLSVLACSTSRPMGGAIPAPRHAGVTVYACPDSVHFSIRQVGDSVVLSLPERTATLPRVAPADAGSS